MGVKVYKELRSPAHLKEIKAKIMKAVGIFCTKIANLNTHIQRIMLCAYIRSQFEYSLPPLILAGDLEIQKAINWERKAIKTFMLLPANTTEEAVVRLTNVDLHEAMNKRIRLIYNLIKQYSPNWAIGLANATLNRSMVKVGKRMAMAANIECIRDLRNFKSAEFTINGEVISGSEALRVIFRTGSKCLPTARKMNLLLFKPLWLNAKTGKCINCTRCKATWGTRHISNCPLLAKYKNLITTWRNEGYYRIQLYINKTELQTEGKLLEEALLTIEKNSDI